MRVSVYGLGYIGCVSAGCLAEMGFSVTGVDVDQHKVQSINDRMRVFAEKDLDELLRFHSLNGNLRATVDPHEGVEMSDVSLVCVGTPGDTSGKVNLTSLKHACETIGNALRDKSGFHVVAVRSTVPPGTVRGQVIPMIERASGKQVNKEFGVVFNPEFLREGSAVEDFLHPPFTVIGCDDEQSGDVVAELYRYVDAPIIRTSMEVAEILKYVCNAYHALKVAFANEIGSLCKGLGIDGREVMNLFTQDKKLNISDVYFIPGFAFGGPCLPKDVRALTQLAAEQGLDLPILSSLMQSNQSHLDRAVQIIEGLGRKRIGILGLSFKEGTDDVRWSPFVDLVHALTDQGFQVLLYDRDVDLVRIFGSNRDYVTTKAGGIESLMVDSIDKLLRHTDVIVVGKRAPWVSTVLSHVRSDQIVVDLVGDVEGKPNIHGICW